MDSRSLAFAEITLLQHDIAEVIIKDGIEIDLVMVKQYHDFLLRYLTSPFSLLINKVNSYTYTFEAQMELGTLAEINAMAVVSYSKASETTTQYLTTLPREIPWNLSMFPNREEALSWLSEQQEKLASN